MPTLEVIQEPLFRGTTEMQEPTPEPRNCEHQTAKTYGSVRWREGAEEESGWVIEAQPDVAMRIKRILPRTQQTALGAILVADSDEVARDIEWIISRWPMSLDRASRRRLRKGARKHQSQVQRVTDILSGTATHERLALAPHADMEPRDYQRTGFDLARASGGLLVADELGVGKTLTSLLALSDPALRPVLVVTLTGLPRQWLRELKKAYPDLYGVEVTRATPYDLTDKTGRTPDLIAMNYAKVAGWSQHLRNRIRTVIFDEVQELRRDGSQKHNAALMLASNATLKMGLSATPIYNFGGEMYSILSVLRPDLVGDRMEFAREWCKSTYGLDSKTRIFDPQGFQSWLGDHGAMIRRTRSEVGFEMPTLSLLEQEVDVDENLAAEGETSAVEIARLILSATSTSRERWSARGDFDWKMRRATGVAKARYVADFARLLLEGEEKIVMVGWHRDVWDIWRERLARFDPVLYTGSESPAQKARSFDAFTEGSSRILMLSLRSGAGLDGLQYTDAQTVVFGELDWSPGVHKQVIGRLHRPGQDRPVVSYFCVTDYGSDPFMTDVLNLKQMEADLLIDPEATPGAAEVTDPGGHITQMARKVLAKHGGAEPGEERERAG